MASTSAALCQCDWMYEPGNSTSTALCQCDWMLSQAMASTSAALC